MEQSLKYSEWFRQSDYDLEVAESMLKSGRNIYCIFMCHLSLEKALKGLFIKRLNKMPPKLHDLMYFIRETSLVVPEDKKDFLVWLNDMSIPVRYPADLRKMMRLHTKGQTTHIYEQSKTTQQWIKLQ